MIKRNALFVTFIGFMAILIAGCSGSSGSAPKAADTIKIENAWARSAMKDGNGAAYMNITNSGADNELVQAKSDVAKTVELHNVIMENGMMAMRPVNSIKLMANKTQVLKPGSYHVMLIGLNRDMMPGKNIKIELIFKSGGSIMLDVPVKKMEGKGMMMHHKMGDKKPMDQIHIMDPWARPAGEGQNTSAIYMMMGNMSKMGDALISAESKVANTVELHNVIMENGMMAMRPVNQIEIAAGGHTELKPGSYHIMLIDLKHPLKVGDMVPVKLKFKMSGYQLLRVPVKEMQKTEGGMMMHHKM